MRKALTFVFSFLAISGCLLGQTETKGIMLGLNGTSFVKNFLSFNEVNTSGTSPFQFTFRKIFANNAAFRSSLGLNLSTTTQSSDGDDDQTTIMAYQVNFAPGYEKRNQIAKRWLIYGGIDAIINYQNTTVKNTSEGEVSTDKIITAGGGFAPVFGLQFNITDRLSLSTESQLRLLYTQTKQTEAGGLSSNSSETNTVALSALLPGFVYVNVLF